MSCESDWVSMSYTKWPSNLLIDGFGKSNNSINDKPQFNCILENAVLSSFWHNYVHKANVHI